MFPSSSNGDQFPFTSQSMLGNSFTDNENPSSSKEHHPSPFLHFPEHFLADDNEFFLSHFLTQPPILGCSSNLAAEAGIQTASPVKATKKTTKKKKNTGHVEKQAVPRKRAGKKDRHSKIYTAQGPRDRRMRLSLQIARKFFDLQDMLGFDKASKTIDWLFSKSMAAIKELAESLPSVKNSCTGGTKSLSSTSESEVISAINAGDQKSPLAIAESLVGSSKGVMIRKSHKPIIKPIARDSRNKARARARERTIEKMKMRGLEKSNVCSEEANPNDLEQLRCSSPLQTAENFGSSSHEKNSSLKVVASEEEEESGMVHLPEHQMDSVSIIEKFLGITTSPRSVSIFDYTHNVGESSVSNSQQNNSVYAGNWNNADDDSVQYSYFATTNMKGSTVNLQAQNSGAIFKINPAFQEQKYSSIYMMTDNTNGQNPNSDLKGLSGTHDQKPSSLVMTTSNMDCQTHFLADQFSCNPIADNKYCSLY